MSDPLLYGNQSGQGNSQPGAGATEPDITGLTPPSQKYIDFLHGRASITQTTDIHHRIGFGPADAAAGDHSHDGSDSTPLWNGQLAAVPGSPTNAQLATALNLVISQMNQKSSS